MSHSDFYWSNQEQEKWIDDDGLMHLEPLPSDRVENSILYTVTYWLLNGLDHDNEYKLQFKALLESLEHNGLLYDAPVKIEPLGHTKIVHLPSVPCSHDNMTAIITMMARLNMPMGHIKITSDYIHPRDFIYMGYVARRWWSYPLLPLLLVVFLWMGMTKYKVRNGRKIFKTDTEILYWIRLHLPKRYWFIHLSKYLIAPLMKRKFGANWVKTMMETYYQNPNHPNRNVGRFE